MQPSYRNVVLINIGSTRCPVYQIFVTLSSNFKIKIITMKTITFLFTFLLTIMLSSIFAQNTKVKAESIEDWESGTMTQFDWETGGSADWFITDANPYEGTYCVQSGDISDNQVSWLSLQYDVYAEDTLSFWLKVSSESNYDYLRFYIDNTEIDNWSGEVAWQKVSFVVPVGNHVFKWEYDKDYSVSSGSDAAWIDYIVFPPMEIAAGFMASTTQSCVNETVDFTDLSVGPITTWWWTFEGGQPANSSQQNPTVMYPNVGVFDVTLFVSDGYESDTLLMPDYIEVNEVPAAPPTPMGLTQLCLDPFNTTYNTMGSTGATDYIWLLLPDDAGVITGNVTSAVVDWSDTFLGDATIRVAGTNYCGEGDFSLDLTVTIYEAPNVTLEPFDDVCIQEPPFELTGGNPTGGTYSGDGVTNNIFDPQAAGTGTHTITYYYEDIFGCSNTATADIYVDPCTGVDETSYKDGILIYPNPNNGKFTIKITNNEIVNINIVNSLNQTVYSKTNVNTAGGFVESIDLNNLSKGIYFIHITGSGSNIIRKILINK